jgi:hypothetical protein
MFDKKVSSLLVIVAVSVCVLLTSAFTPSAAAAPRKPSVPAVPTRLTATAASTSQINVSWKASTGATGYDLEIDGVATLGVTSPYPHTGLAANSTHTYRVRAKNSAGASAWSAAVTATTLQSVPAVPTGLTATPASSSQINVAWSASTGATGHDLEIDGVATLGVTSPYPHTGLAANSTHTYSVRANNTAGASAWSAAVTATTNGSGTWGSSVFAPYVDVMLWPTFSIDNACTLTGQKYYTLAFVTSDRTGTGVPAWGGVTAMSSNFYLKEINAIRARGGDVIVSFGGAAGREIASDNIDATTLQARYQEVIDRYQLTWIDFDIEGAAVADRAAIDKRNKAIKGLQDANPGLTVAYCLPVLPSGLTGHGLYVLSNAKTNGVRVDVVNVMAMDYGDSPAPNPDGKMGDYAIQAATSTRNQCTTIGISPKIGVTPMIGQNDVASEKFYQSDAQKLLTFAQANDWVRLLSMWSVNRDNSVNGPLYKSSQIPQTDFEFTNIFKAFK